MSGGSPVTTIFEVFGKVDQIDAALQSLVAQAPTYAQFSRRLQQISQQLSAIQDQLTAVQNQSSAILLLLEGVLQGMATLNNQQQILQLLRNISAALPTGRIVGDPSSVILEHQPLPQP